MKLPELRARHRTDRVRDEEQDLRPSKRCKREMETTWGLGEEKEEQDKQRDWLMIKEQTCSKGETKQLLIKPWTWLQIETRKVLIEIVSKVETEAIERRSKKEQGSEVQELVVRRRRIARQS